MSAAGRTEIRVAVGRYRVQRDIEDEIADRGVTALSGDAVAMVVIRSWASRLSDGDLGRLCRRLIGELDADALRRLPDTGATDASWMVAVAAFLLGMAAAVSLFAGAPVWLTTALGLGALVGAVLQRRLTGRGGAA